MQSEESKNPADWIRIAARDLKRARLFHDHDDLEGSGFFIQQSVEKYLKGFLLSRGWELKRTHDLGLLPSFAVEHEPSLEKFRPACLRITEYYIEERYPTAVVSELSRGELEASMASAAELIDTIKGLAGD